MINPVLINLGPLSIRWYGITATLAALAAFLYLKQIALKLKIKTDITNLYFWLIIAGVLGARLYHVINEINYYLAHPSLILMIWKGGLAIHGGVIAGIFLLLYYSKKHKISFLKLTDLFAPAMLLMLGIARWGNFFNQELFGTPTSLPWGIFIDIVNRPQAFANFTHFHPCFLYQSLWNLIALIPITLWIIKKPPKKTGIIFAVSLVAWSIGRILAELLRIDNVPLILGIRLPLIVSVLILITGATILYQSKLKKH